MLDLLTGLIAICTGVVVPLSILGLRETVRVRRLAIIDDLERVFVFTDQDGRTEKIVPSFEFVKYKYDRGNRSHEEAEHRPDGTGKVRGGDHGSCPSSVQGAGPRSGPGRRDEFHPHPNISRDASVWVFVACAVPLLVITTALSFFTVGLVLATFFGQQDPAALVVVSLEHIGAAQQTNLVTLHAWVIAATFTAVYLFVLRNLLRAVNNFDLSPSSFVSAALQIILALAAAAVIVAGGLSRTVGAFSEGALLSAAVIVAFIVGLVPEFGPKVILRTTTLWLFKREDAELYKAFQTTPVEIIDGIDSEVRSRLSEFSIVSTQHLATANPIMLFVETPFGIYQVIDWVAQAQLCTAVGARKMIALWNFGIRTIFDLERAILNDTCGTKDLRLAIGRVLLSAVPGGRIASIMESQPLVVLDDETVRSHTRKLLDDLHVQRLRQITNRIQERLGGDSLQLRPLTCESEA